MYSAIFRTSYCILKPGMFFALFCLMMICIALSEFTVSSQVMHTEMVDKINDPFIYMHIAKTVSLLKK